MSRSLFSRTLLAFALAAVLLVPGASAARHRTMPTVVRASRDILAPLWSFLSELRAKIGCGLDPHGSCTPTPTSLEEGCGLDPNGLCETSLVTTDEGCGLDPDGRCNSH